MRAPITLVIALTVLGCADDETATSAPATSTNAGTGAGQGGSAVGTGGTGGAGGAGGSGGTAVPLNCSSYCTAYEETCPRHALYPQAWCEAIRDPTSSAMPIGSSGDTGVNTLACRIEHLQAAMNASGTERDAECDAAHLSGDNTCGSFCDAYCALTDAVCSPSNPNFGNGPALYPNDTACRDACNAFGTAVLDGVAQPEALFGYGDTAQCRLHHAHAAAAELPSLHCGHASAQSTADTCSDSASPNWANYCAFALEHCTGAQAVVQATEQAGCMAELNTWSPPFTEGGFNSFTNASGHSIGCMNYWIVQSPHDPTACAKAHPSTGSCQ